MITREEYANIKAGDSILHEDGEEMFVVDIYPPHILVSDENCEQMLDRTDIEAVVAKGFIQKSAQNIGLTNTSGKEDIMRRTEFNKLVESVIDEIRARLITKGAEYADNDNVFRNFDNAAKMRGITPIQALEGMLLKHQVSIQDIVEGRSPNKREVVWEKVLDEVCYRILEIGLLRRDEDAPF